MQCPRCQHTKTKVYDSRITHNGKITHRRRECLHCRYRFTTHEEIKSLDLQVQKRSGQIVDFSSEKLEKGIRKAYNKRRIDNANINQLLQNVIEDILKTNTNPIPSTTIGSIVLQNLRDIDEAAYICYWAMFGNFETADEFNNLLKEFQ